MIGVLMIFLIGGVCAADNTSHDEIVSSNYLNTSYAASFDENELHSSVQKSNGEDMSEQYSFFDDSENNSSGSFDVLSKPDADAMNSYDGKYYLFRGDCWSINNNFESSAASSQALQSQAKHSKILRLPEHSVPKATWWESTGIQRISSHTHT